MAKLSEVQIVNGELYKQPERSAVPYGCLDQRLVN
jgi:hypothetical protein